MFLLVPHPSTNKEEPKNSIMTDLLHRNLDRPFPSLFSIDSFQLSLFDLVDNASDIEIGHFSAYKTADLYRFMIKLYITSLDSNSPQRTTIEKDELAAHQLTIDSITSVTSIEVSEIPLPDDEEIDITDYSTNAEDHKISDYEQNDKPSTITIIEPYKYNIKEKALYNDWRNLLTNINHTPNIPHTPETPQAIPSGIIHHITIHIPSIALLALHSQQRLSYIHR